MKLTKNQTTNMVCSNKQKSIDDLKNWSEEAINMSELEANDIKVNWKQSLDKLKKIVHQAKKDGLSLKEVLGLVWSYENEAKKFYLEQFGNAAELAWLKVRGSNDDY